MPVNSPFAADGSAVGQDGAITVPMLLNSPRRIYRDTVSVAAVNYRYDQVLSDGGGTSGGALVFDVAQARDEFLDRDVQEVGELAEFPLLNGEEGIPDIAKVRKVGGKLLISDEKRDRNEIRYVNREITRLGNTMADQTERAGMAAVDKAIVDYNRTTPVSLGWDQVVPNGAAPTPFESWPHADLARARAKGRVDGIGGDYDVLVIHPNDYVLLDIIYDGNPERFWSGTKGTFYQSTNQTEGKPLLSLKGQAGGTYWEKRIGVEKWREPGVEGTYIQVSGRAVHVVDNPPALLELSGVSS